VEREIGSGKKGLIEESSQEVVGLYGDFLVRNTTNIQVENENRKLRKCLASNSIPGLDGENQEYNQQDRHSRTSRLITSFLPWMMLSGSLSKGSKCEGRAHERSIQEERYRAHRVVDF